MAIEDNTGELFETDDDSVIQDADDLDAHGVVSVSYLPLTLPSIYSQ